MFKKLLFTLSIAFFLVQFAYSQTVTGVVTDAETGEPLVGVTILVTGTTVGATTNLEGRYQITVPEDRNVLEFSFIGYQTVREEVDGREEINVELSEDLQLLDDVVVVGYGTMDRRQVTSSISQISSRDLEDTNLSTTDQALQGRVSGVQFTSTSGVLGAPSSIRIRGAASITASTTPLVVIDGIPVTNPTTAGSATIGIGAGGAGINPLLNLNPNDIESFEVLKDASASAIYGSRGSNGVILITTKSGRADQQIVNIRSTAGVVSETNNYDMMNGEEFTQIWNDAASNLFGVPLGEDTPFSLPREDITNTNWMDLVSQTGYMQETSASVSGGTEATRYYISGTYRWEEGFVRNNELNRYSARLRLDHSLTDNVKVGLNINPTRTDNFRVYTENAVAAPFTYAALYYPNVAPRDEDGSLNLDVAPNPFGQFSGTPLSNVEGVNFESNLTQLITAADLEWNITENLAFNTNFSVDLFQLSERYKRATFSTDGFPDGNAFALQDQYRNYNLNATLQFRDNWDDHTLSVLGGLDLQHSTNNAFSAFARGFPNDLLQNISSAAEPITTTGTGTSYAFEGYFSRASYSYLDRYMLTATARVDGSSRFGIDNRYGFFPSLSAGWIVSDEEWYGNNAAVDFLKLRASVGQTGNAEIGNFAYQGLVGFGNNYNGVAGGAITQLGNPDLRWEKTTQLDGAIEFGIFESHLRGSVGYYIKDTDDLLLDVPISSVNGFTTFTQNVGEIRNQGMEVELTADVFQGDFSWTSSVNVSTVKNEVISLVEGQDDQIFGQHIVREGEPLGSFYQVRYAGPNPENGNAQWLTADGEVTENYSTDHRVITGNPFPDYFGGFTNTFAYRGLDMRVFFQFSYGNDIYRGDGGFTDSNLNSLFNQSTRQNDYWTPENTDAANPRPILLEANGSQASTRYLEDGSYLRLKQATIGYTLPEELTGNVRARIYAQGTNLLTFTDFNGMDPEAASSGNITANSIFFQLPQPRTIQMGINLTF